jgi:GrpB-like predicted nucleotidyltransferase (UPF0157 family)
LLTIGHGCTERGNKGSNKQGKEGAGGAAHGLHLPYECSVPRAGTLPATGRCIHVAGRSTPQAPRAAILLQTFDGGTKRQMSDADEARIEELRAVTVGELLPLESAVMLVPHDRAWRGRFEREADRILAAVGRSALAVEHVGSTSVPGLSAKPVIDILLVVPDAADEPSYVPALEAAGYALRIREPDWYQHRVLRGEGPAVNLHVFPPDCPETERMLAFRDHLRAHDADRDLYERTKRDLAARAWRYTQQYADAKGPVVEAILVRALAARRLAGTDGESYPAP